MPPTPDGDAVGPGGDAVMRALCLGEMAPWLGAPVRSVRAEEVYQHLNTTIRSVFLFRLRDGVVELLPKPAFRVRDTFNDSSQPEPTGPVVYREEYTRAVMYRAFFERLLAGNRTVGDMLIAIDVNDAPIGDADAPVFAFQKMRGNRTVLIPDVDFLHANFYIPVEYRDETPYASKLPRAIFAGSTTGGRTITTQDVRDLAIHRLRSGVFFKNSDLVDFRLPRIVQYESPDVRDMIEALGVNNHPCSWQEQFGHRFILSMDGNGATCSRVAIGLGSQSALVKYASPHVLYYFAALVPWRHFAPAESDDDVLRIVEAERQHPDMFAGVAAEGRRFAQRYLGRAGVCSYTVELLRLFETNLAQFRSGRGLPAKNESASASLLPLVECGAHVQGIGDVWGWPGEWIGEAGSGRAIEAIVVAPSGLPREAFSYRVVLHDGSLSDPSAAGEFCGTRGADRPLLGFELHIHEAWAARLACRYGARFVDGTTAGPLSAGQLCQSSSGAALESFDISMTDAAASRTR